MKTSPHQLVSFLGASLLLALALNPLAVFAEDLRWPEKKAQDWYAQQPWLFGFNYLPSTAVNDVEMWQADTFDFPTIERELGWARDLGFNSIRVFLNYVVWEADRDGLKGRFEKVLALADKLGMRVMPILLDDCNFGNLQTTAGKQPDPIPGRHNNRWVSSPSREMCRDKSQWPKLEKYVKDFVTTYANDRRIVIWDLYNEPTKANDELVAACFKWAREVNPSQPLSSCFSAEPYSDLRNLHPYATYETTCKMCEANIKRPVIVTEWMARHFGSNFETLLPYFKSRKISCWQWGLVNGRTQTYFPWGSKEGDPAPSLWFHDLLRKDGSPFSWREIYFIKVLTGKIQAVPGAEGKVLVPTAEKQPVSWRYTTERPSDDWFEIGFADSQWKQGPAPFGVSAEPNKGKPGRQARTEWKEKEIWLRREFEMPMGDFLEIALRMHFDDRVQVYIDGVPAAAGVLMTDTYQLLPLTEEITKLLKPGKHVMAIHCIQTEGGQFIDAGIEAFPSIPGLKPN